MFFTIFGYIACWLLLVAYTWGVITLVDDGGVGGLALGFGFMVGVALFYKLSLHGAHMKATIVGKMQWPNENELTEVIRAICSRCGVVKHKSYFIGDKYRLTWCNKCNRVVEWVRLYGPRNKTINDKGESIEEM